MPEEKYRIVAGSTVQWFTVGKKGKVITVERAHDMTSDTTTNTIYDENGELNTNEREHKEISAVVSKYLEKKEQTIEIEVKGGTVVDVRNLPEGCNYEVTDRAMSKVKAWNVVFIRSEIISAETREEVEETAEHFRRKQEIVGSIEEANE